jgi:hypothetical protein
MSTDNGSITDTHTIQDRNMGTYPHVFSDYYSTTHLHLPLYQRYLLLSKLVISRSYVGVSGDKSALSHLKVGLCRQATIRPDIHPVVQNNPTALGRHCTKSTYTHMIANIYRGMLTPNV